jgi:glycosyltransferase involved in cell wall biosynthesis
VIVFAWVCFGCAAVPALLYLWNSLLFREPPEPGEHPRIPPISVLIPARNEEFGIAACVESVLASRQVELEVIVLDDHSIDRTAEIVREIAAKDSRLRLETAPPLPGGWCGKQHACFVLSKLAKHDVLTFLDADVRLDPDALAAVVLFLQKSGSALVSGFPRQETGTFLEKLLIPLIHWLLLCWLPLWGMRHFRWSAFGAGCGQCFMTTREAYEKVGGHAAVKSSLHDGLTLPRAYRKAGFFTDICDATGLATCRMYRSAGAVWNGLAKNAREGMASNGQIGFWTVVLLCGQVMPFVMLAACLGLWVGHELPSPDPPTPELLAWAEADLIALRISAAACLVTILPRSHAAWRFRQSWRSAFLHPLGVLALLAIQWYAISRSVTGRPVGWKGRAHPTRN